MLVRIWRNWITYVDENEKWYSHSEKKLGSFLRNKTSNYKIKPAIQITTITITTYTHMSIEAGFILAKNWKHPRGSSTI